ncbi:amino acid transporter [Hortaea werneckii]|uniref:Amino acid transporter transmembrane domain-containing protein n=1 Tax=Hortaea werneckii TaxID=91943 RepID=A0A3M7A9P1_HORWE|nr:amino acid transporter [Hortaea werneckii]KAI7027434.1 amino acid transporter [Hortaea werneckii]KAI7675964.1 amino acid transporter [Hortaea werneckii]RMY24112.1 hypothetical protein D0867_01593 [Hortaea werneckii]RMY39745.1 hypothetical protein D0866_01720 [Hortaea werneckii]
MAKEPGKEPSEPVDHELGLVPSQPGVVDNINSNKNNGPNYHNVGWIGSAVLMVKTQVGLGVLSIPAVFDTLGLIPGIICLLAVGGITTWAGHIVGTFKANHPEVYSISDAGFVILGKAGREVLGFAYCLCWIFVAGSAMLSNSISFNAMSTHGACTAIFVAVAAVIGFGFASIRTLGRISLLAWIGLVSIVVSIITVTVAVGAQDRPASAPQTGPWSSDFKLFQKPQLGSAMSAISSLVFAFGGTPAFFNIATEMRNQQHYARSLMFCQGFVTTTYVTIGIVVYVYCGSFVASPALGSAGVLIKKICYGLALPGLIITTVLFIHLAAKYAFFRILKNSEHLVANSVVHWSTWIACTLSTTVVAYVIASGIPVFGGLVSLIGALIEPVLVIIPYGLMWLYDNWTTDPSLRTKKWMCMVCWCVFIVVAGIYVTISGTYGSILDITRSYNKSGGSAAWSCADNSNSV